MYYICKFTNSLTVYDGNKHTSRQLDPAEVELIKKLFPELIPENKLLSAIQISPINPNKLQLLEKNKSLLPPKKTTPGQ